MNISAALKLTALFSFILSSSVAFGQVALMLSSGTASAGGNVSLNLSLDSIGTQPAALQWTFSFPASDFSSISVTPGPSASSAYKMLICSGASGEYTCILIGLTGTTIPDGIIASVSLSLSSGTNPRMVGVTNALSASLQGDSLTTLATGGVVTVGSATDAPAGLSQLTCASSSLAGSGSLTCSVVLQSAAPTGGTVVALSDNTVLVTIPASVTVPAGAVTANFTISSVNVWGYSAAMLTASLNGTIATFPISLLPTPDLQISSLLCNPTSLVSDDTGTCTITLNRAARAGGSIVTVDDDDALLTAPTLVTVPAGASSVTFTVSAGTITTQQTAVITATLNVSSNSSSQETSISLFPRAAACPCSFWSSGNTPTIISDSDTVPVELGMKFRSKVAGYVLGVRFYKGPQNTGTHTGKLWTKGGTLLGSVTFTNETASGWQQASFSNPVAIAANTTYIISYWSPASHYSLDLDYFASTGTTNGPLYALMDGEDGGNGAYNYLQSAFPATTWNSSNYWVDVIFNTVPSTTRIVLPLSLTTKLTSPQDAMPDAMSGVETARAEASPAAVPTGTLSCAPKVVRAGGPFTCELQLPQDGDSPGIPVTAASSYVRLPAAVQARPQQRLLTFHGTVDNAAPRSTFAVSVGEAGILAEDQITILPSLAPVLSLPGAQFAKAGEPVSFLLSAVDPAGLPVQISASNLPDGASFQQDSGRFEWSPALHQQGNHTLTFTAVNANGDSAESQTQILVDSGNPVIAKLAQGLCSPSAVATLEGRWLRPSAETFADPSGSSLELGGARVRVNGSPMPVLFAGQTRVDFLCPSADAGTSLEITLETPSGPVAPERTSMAAAHPQLLLAPDLGSKQALVTIADTDRIAVAREYHGVGEPAQLGDVVSFRATGLGIADSYAGSLVVKVDGVDAQVESVSPAPNAAGVFLIQVRIPAAASLGSEIPVFLELVAPDGQRHSSNTATIAIE